MEICSLVIIIGIIKSSCYDSVLRVPFENITIPIPDGYDEILRIYYGDYMVPVQGTSDHNYPFYKEQRKEILDTYREKGLDVPKTLLELLGG